MRFLSGLLAAEGQPAQQPRGDSWVILLVAGALILVLIIFAFVQARQRKKQQEEIDDAMNKLKPGDKVMTIGHIYGRIVSVDHDNDVFVITSGSEEQPSYLTVDKMAIYQVIYDKKHEEAAAAEAQKQASEDAFVNGNGEKEVK